MEPTTPTQGQAITPTNGGKKSAPTLREFLMSDAVKKRIDEVARGHLKPEDLIRFALLAQSRQPELAKCSQTSVLAALMDAAALGIRPGGLMGRGYLVPRKNRKNNTLECQFDPGYRGLVDIVRRSGEIARIFAEVAKENDAFDYALGDEPYIHHKPTTKGPRGKTIAAYAVVVFKDGSKQMDVMLLEEIEKRRQVSAAQSGPWMTWFDEMAKKTVLRAVCKMLPYEEKLERALELATDAESEEPIGRLPEIDEPKQPRGKALAGKIRERADADKTPDIDIPEIITEDGEIVGGSDDPDSPENP